MKRQEDSCPVDFVAVNEQKLKIVALQVFLLSGFFAIFNIPVLIIILATDFLLRSLNLNVISPLSIIAETLVKVLRIENLPIDGGSKKFAARMGLTFSLLVIVFWYTGFYKTSLTFSIMISLFSFLESSVGFCVGCHVYSLSKALFRPRNVEGQRARS